MPHYDFYLDFEGPKADIQKLLNEASKTERGAYKKEWKGEGKCRVWFRGTDIGPPNDLMAAIKRAAGLTGKRKSKPKVEDVSEDVVEVEDDPDTDS